MAAKRLEKLSALFLVVRFLSLVSLLPPSYAKNRVAKVGPMG